MQLASRLADSANSAHTILVSSKHLLPLTEHQRGPQQRRPVVIPSLVLVPNLLQKILVQNPVFGFKNDLSSHWFQFAPEPLRERNGEPLLCTVQNVRRQNGLKCFLEDVFSGAVA